MKGFTNTVLGAFIVCSLLFFAWAAWPVVIALGLLLAVGACVRYFESVSLESRTREVEVLLRQRCETRLGTEYEKISRKVFENTAKYVTENFLRKSDSVERKLDVVKMASDDIVSAASPRTEKANGAMFVLHESNLVPDSILRDLKAHYLK